MRALGASIAMLCACASESRVDVAAGGTRVQGPAPFAPAHSFRTPIDNAAAISSTFGPRWKTSASRDDFHLGIDYYGSLGDPLRAIGPGRVAQVHLDGSTTWPAGGNVIVVEHVIEPRAFHGQPVSRFFACYLHANSIDVAVGDAVIAGQQIGTMGKTGDTDFVHLHFETRVETTCSLQYQTAHPESSCAIGFDPHVHPYLFVGGANDDAFAVEEIATTRAYAVRYTATRGDLDLDIIDTDLGTIGFDERRGLDATALAKLDDFDAGFVRIIPREFGVASTLIEYELHFTEHPGHLELRDVYGNGIRY